MAEEHRKINPYDTKIISGLVGYYGVLGERAVALNLIGKLAAAAPNDVHVTFKMPQTYEQLGDRANALHWLDKALKLGYSRRGIGHNPWLKNLHTDERYKRLPEDIPAR